VDRGLQFDSQLRERILGHLARFRVIEQEPTGLRHAAVGVVLLGDAAGRACFVLTRRLATLRRHAGQWALPGGQLEAAETVIAAVLREVREEINLSLEPEAALGRLDDFVSRSGHLISPVVLWAADADGLVANPDEVDAAFVVPADELEHVRMRPLLHFAMPSVPTTVHAPTAALLYQFREVALHGREVRVADFEQPFFAWR
jgi:8-oxo-dGTP pyrophosphatase MutT (NUDIX family)